MSADSPPTVLPSGPTVAPDETSHSGGGEGRIKCPLCGWQPRAEDRWFCTSCKYSWNTFDTGGACPGCLKQWTATMCLACHQWSAHSDWYPNG